MTPVIIFIQARRPQLASIMPHWDHWCPSVPMTFGKPPTPVFTTPRLLITCPSTLRYFDALGVKPFSGGSVSRRLTLVETWHPLTEIAGVTMFWCQKSYPSADINTVFLPWCADTFISIFSCLDGGEGGGTQSRHRHRWILCWTKEAWQTNNLTMYSHSAVWNDLHGYFSRKI